MAARIRLNRNSRSGPPSAVGCGLYERRHGHILRIGGGLENIVLLV
jgi:hypothetical protein